MLQWHKVVFQDKQRGSDLSSVSGSSLNLPYPCVSSFECSPYFITLRRGFYLFECWGARGGYTNGYSSQRSGGAFCSGFLVVSKTTLFSCNVGGEGGIGNINPKGGNNGGGSGGIGGGGGGGATDIRLDSTLNSRIIVAAGGGGRDGDSFGGMAGGLEGGNGDPNINSKIGYGGTQTSGGSGNPIGSFGQGGDSETVDGAGGGGGYWGGGHGYGAHNGGGGGSSFISGYHGCNSVKSQNDTQPSNSPNHYSRMIFIHSTMLNGSSSIEDPITNITEIGHLGNGYIRITFINQLSNNSCNKHGSLLHSFLFFTNSLFLILYLS